MLRQLGQGVGPVFVLFDAGQGVEEHVNDEVEVLIVALAGAGFVAVDSQRHGLAPGMVIAIPARRGGRSGARASGSAT